MIEDICYVVATQKTEEEFWAGSTPIALSLKKSGHPSSVFYSNTRGLSVVYNEAISTLKDKYRWLVFVHDDVLVCDMFVLEKLDDGKKSHGFDIMGLAGSRHINIKNQLVAWHTGNDPKRDWSGSVAHPMDDSRILVSTYGPFNEPVLTLDGLFIAVNTEILKNSQICFDTQFEFDFYDMDFCVNAYNNHSIKLGTVDIFVEHSSTGKGIHKESYKSAQDLFVKKWEKKK